MIFYGQGCVYHWRRDGITGGIARAFAEHGARLAITSRKEENLIAKKQFIEENGGECLAVAADVRDYAAVENAIAKTSSITAE